MHVPLTFDLVSWCVISDGYWIISVGQFDLQHGPGYGLQEEGTTGMKETGVHLQGGIDSIECTSVHECTYR